MFDVLVFVVGAKKSPYASDIPGMANSGEDNRQL
jgi:hypothetical protein